MARALDKQIQEYLPLLGTEEKKSLLGVIRSFLSLKEEQESRISLEQYNRETDAALARVKGGSFAPQKDVEKAAAKW